MKKRQMLSFVLLTSLVISTGAHAWPWNKSKTFTETMFDGLCTVLRTTEDTLTGEYEIIKENMPNFVRSAFIRSLAGSIATVILAYAVYKPGEALINWLRTSSEERRMQRLISEYNALAEKIKVKAMLAALPEEIKKQKDELANLVAQIQAAKQKKTEKKVN